jgi:hypothetical protein
MAAFGFSSSTSNSLVFLISNLDTSYANRPRDIWVCSFQNNSDAQTAANYNPGQHPYSGNYNGILYSFPNGVSNAYVTVSGLLSGTTYYSVCWIHYYNDLTGASGGWVQVRAPMGLYGEPILTAATQASARPPYFSWTYPKNQNSAFMLTAIEWENFFANLNAVRVYKNLSNYAHTPAVQGNPFTAAQFNEAFHALEGINSSAASAISTVQPGSPVTAYELNQLVTLLNGVN